MKKDLTNNQKFVRDTIELKHKIEGAFIDLGARLKKIRDEKLYEGSYSNFAEFLVEMDLSEGTASKIIAVQSFYSEKHKISREKLAQAGWSKLYTMLKLTDDSTPKNEVEKVVQKGIELWRPDIEDEVREHVTGCTKHDFGDIITIRVCRKCGKRINTHEHKD